MQTPAAWMALRWRKRAETSAFSSRFSVGGGGFSAGKPGKTVSDKIVGLFIERHIFDATPSRRAAFPPRAKPAATRGIPSFGRRKCAPFAPIRDGRKPLAFFRMSRRQGLPGIYFAWIEGWKWSGHSSGKWIYREPEDRCVPAPACERSLL
jgi:hypothetical protein